MGASAGNDRAPSGAHRAPEAPPSTTTLRRPVPTTSRITQTSPHDRTELRVLMVVENNSVPSDRRVWDIATTLARVGCEVVVVCPQGHDDERALAEHRDDVQIRRYPLRPGTGGVSGYLREYGVAWWHTWRLVAKLTREHPFDVVHACNPPDFLLFAAWPARRAGARMIFDHHDLTPELLVTRFGRRGRPLRRLALLVERLSFAAADGVLATNESYRRVALTRGRKHASDVFVVRNGPDLRRHQMFPLDPEPKPNAKRPMLIVYVGTMGHQDGVDQALRALALLRERRQDWHAIFAGAGEAVPTLRRLRDELGLHDLVKFVGWLDDPKIAQLLARADICLEPAPSSPLNDVSTMIKIGEYMAMGRPIVAYDLRESRVTAGDAAAYAQPNDVASYAAQIEQLLADPQRRVQMGRQGRARVEQALSWEHSERVLLAAYGRIVGGAQRQFEAAIPSL
jgi:glycosyltransferase involved in cell wall biosynthesis